MVSPFVQSPLGGNLGVRNATIYKLNAAGTAPVATLIELANPFSPDKVGLDVVDSEDWSRSWTVTENPLQDFTAATSNVSKNSDTFSVSGTLISSVDVAFLTSLGVPGVPGFGGGLRADLLKLSSLEAIGNLKEPVMVVTPRRSLAKAFIESISTSWSPDVGDNTPVTIVFREARIVNPLTAEAVVPDVASSFTGNNQVSNAGAQAPLVTQTQSVTLSDIFGVGPKVIPAL